MALPWRYDGRAGTVTDWHDVVLAIHVIAGTAGLALGLVAIWIERHPPFRSGEGTAYHWAVLGVALTALALVASDIAAFWWLIPVAAVSYALALVGYLAPRMRPRWWVRGYAHGQGGAYIALVTALLVVSLDGTAAIAGWILPSLLGIPLIERRVVEIRSAELSEDEQLD
jgi:hypothetical protein